uniref:Transposase n=1 Tax=Schistocephalus solidus TaxID=70667 RepID=A0A183SU77_SCHSO
LFPIAGCRRKNTDLSTRVNKETGTRNAVKEKLAVIINVDMAPNSSRFYSLADQFPEDCLAATLKHRA